jgi:hypothetical protein
MTDWQSGLENFASGEADTDLDEEIDQSDVESVLYHYFRGFNWDFSDISRTDGSSIPVPAKSKCVTAIIEEVSMDVAKQMADDLGAVLIESNSRQYPDVNLRNAFDSNLIALDFKSSRILESGKTISGFTLGSCGKYFSNPTENTSGSKFPYGDYDEHWVVGFAYNWDPSLPSEDMVYDVETLIGQKWEFAKNPTNTNSTNQINSQTELQALRNRVPHFDSEEDFERQWRQQGNG